MHFSHMLCTGYRLPPNNMYRTGKQKSDCQPLRNFLVGIILKSEFVLPFALALYPGPHAERGRGPGDTWQNSRMCSVSIIA